MFKRLASVLTAGLVVASLMAPAAAAPRKLKGSFTASAKPLPSAWMITAIGGCENGMEGVHKVSHPIVAPFGGWLRVQMTFAGNWDLSLEDPAGTYLAGSGYEEATDKDMERLDYYLEEGQEAVIVACNYLSETDAQVSYTLTAGPAWTTEAGPRRVSRIEELSYIAPALASPDFWGICHVGYELGCTATTPRLTDRFVSVEVLDDASPTVSFEIYQYNGNTYLGGQNFCGSTEGPIPVKPGADFIGATAFLGPCKDGTPAMPTRGSVLMEFSNRK